jgi:hypothetical protein
LAEVGVGTIPLVASLQVACMVLVRGIGFIASAFGVCVLSLRFSAIEQLQLSA